MSEWFYKPSWRESKLRPRTPAKVSNTGSRWLIFADDLGFADAVTAKLRAAGEQVTTVNPGAQFGKRGEDLFEIRRTQPEDYERLIRQLREEGRLPGKVGHFWSVTPALDTERGSELEEFEEYQELGYYSLLSIVKRSENNPFLIRSRLSSFPAICSRCRVMTFYVPPKLPYSVRAKAYHRRTLTSSAAAWTLRCNLGGHPLMSL